MPSPPSSNIAEVLQETKHPEEVIFCFYYVVRALSTQFPHYLESIRRIVENLNYRDLIRTTVADCYQSLLEFLRQTADVGLIGVFNGVLDLCQQPVQFLLNRSQPPTDIKHCWHRWFRPNSGPNDNENSKRQSILDHLLSPDIRQQQQQQQSPEIGRQNSDVLEPPPSNNLGSEDLRTEQQNRESMSSRHMFGSESRLPRFIDAFIDQSSNSPRATNVHVLPNGDVSLALGGRVVTINLSDRPNVSRGGVGFRIRLYPNSLASNNVQDNGSRTIAAFRTIDPNRSSRMDNSPQESSGSEINQMLQDSRNDIQQSLQYFRNNVHQILQRFRNVLQQSSQDFGNDSHQMLQEFRNMIQQSVQDFRNDSHQMLQRFRNVIQPFSHYFRNGSHQMLQEYYNMIEQSLQDFQNLCNEFHQMLQDVRNELSRELVQLSGMTRVRSEPGYPQELSPDATFINSSATDRNNLTDDGIRAFVDIPYGEELDEEEEEEDQ